MSIEVIQSLIRDVPDFPKPGIMFKDITPIFQDPEGLKATVDLFTQRLAGQSIDKVIGIESRGFLLGAPIAVALGVGCGLVRKRKAAVDHHERSYDLSTARQPSRPMDLVREESEVILDDLLGRYGGRWSSGRSSRPGSSLAWLAVGRSRERRGSRVCPIVF